MRRFYEGAVVQLGHRLPDFGLGVHHDGAVPGDGFLNGCARNQQKAQAIGAGGDADLVAGAKFDQRAVAGKIADVDLLAADLFFQQNAARGRGIAEFA